MERITLEEVKLRLVRRLERTPLVTWPVLKHGMTSGEVVTEQQVKDAANALKSEGKVSLIAGSRGGAYVCLAEFGQGIDCARQLERIE